MKAIINLTEHNATEQQIKLGVFEPSDEQKARLKSLLTFNNLSDTKNIAERAKQMALIAESYGSEYAMIDGAPFFMSHLEKALTKFGINSVYAFSPYENTGESSPTGLVRADGSVIHNIETMNLDEKLELLKKHGVEVCETKEVFDAFSHFVWSNYKYGFERHPELTSFEIDEFLEFLQNNPDFDNYGDTSKVCFSELREGWANATDLYAYVYENKGKYYVYAIKN